MRKGQGKGGNEGTEEGRVYDEDEGVRKKRMAGREEWRTKDRNKEEGRTEKM